jgi:hypothetical protein
MLCSVGADIEGSTSTAFEASTDISGGADVDLGTGLSAYNEDDG